MRDFPRKAKFTQIQGAIFATVIIANSCRIFRRILRHKIWGNHASLLDKILCCCCEATIAEVRSAGQDSQMFSGFSSRYRLCPSHAAYAKWCDDDRAPICAAKVSRTVRKLSVTHTGFAFPLAKRDYHCFNKAQRALGNGARLGFASIQGL
jgi:hypothetical protein